MRVVWSAGLLVGESVVYSVEVKVERRVGMLVVDLVVKSVDLKAEATVVKLADDSVGW